MPGKYKFKYRRKVRVLILTVTVMVVIPWLLPGHLPAQEKDKKGLAEEIIKLSKLEKKGKVEFSIQRDIFSPDPMKPPDPMARPQRNQPPPPPIEIKPLEPVKTDEKDDIENEIRDSLFYEGYVIKHSKNYALVSMNGEFYAVTIDDMVLEKIKITKIEREAITVEVDSYTFEIQLKGDEENAIQ